MLIISVQAASHEDAFESFLADLGNVEMQLCENQFFHLQVGHVAHAHTRTRIRIHASAQARMWVEGLSKKLAH